MIDVVPVFPLPNTVFYPTTELPLHIFEPRYRAMVRDVTRGDGRIVVALADADGFHETATVGRIQDLETLPDGRSNLTLVGQQRVALTEVPSELPYRQVQIDPRPESIGADDEKAIADAGLELLATFGILQRMTVGSAPLVLHQELPLNLVVNTICSSLPIDADSRQRLLEQDSLMERQRLAILYLNEVIDTLTLLERAQSGGSSMMN